MPDISMTDAEAAALKELLERFLGDLSVEIADTDLKSFRDGLKEKRELLKAIQKQLD